MSTEAQTRNWHDPSETGGSGRGIDRPSRGRRGCCIPNDRETGSEKGRAGAEAANLDSVGNPLALLIEEHDDAGVLLAEIRSLSRNFTAPEYACTTYHAFFEGLKDFEHDLHRHVHLENNIL